jgi:hypothetical protein
LRSGGRFAYDWAARDVFDIAAANTDVAEIVVGELGQFAHCRTISAPSGQFFRDRLEGDHDLLLSCFGRPSACCAAT